MLNNKLGLMSIILLGVNAIIGTGIFLLPGKAAALVGVNSLWVIVFDALLVMSIALCFAEMGGMFNKNGGPYVYAKEAFGNFVGFEVQMGVIYYAAQKIFEGERNNAKVSLFDIAGIEEIVAPGEVDRFYINFCDPWPKAKHAKRRLTYHTFLDRYARLLKDGGEVHFKTDNEGLFMFSLEEFKECGWELKNVTYDLHSTDLPNVKTEYEEKFSKKGQPIFRLEAIKPKVQKEA